MLPLLLTIVISYLLGSIPFGLILVRLLRGQDIRTTGSGNIGATNVARSSPALGLLTLLLDAAKGVLAVQLAAAIARRMDPGNEAALLWLMCVAAVFAIIGHIFPVWLNFRGGKGVATAVGGFLCLAPYAVAGSLIVFLIAVIATRYVSLGSVLAAAGFPFFVMWLYKGFESRMITLLAAASLLVIWRHRKNIARLLGGTESRFQLRRG
jgi:glycerol-3-phosphate acyltransferase PlsY